MEFQSSNTPPPLPPAPPPSLPLGPSRTRVWLWLLMLVPLVGLFGVLAVVAAAAFLVLSGRLQEIAAGDKEILVDVHRLAPWLGDYQINPSADSIAKTQYNTSTVPATSTTLMRIPKISKPRI